MLRLFVSALVAGACLFSFAPAGAQPIDCASAIDTANEEWNASAELIQCAEDGNAAAESVLGMIYLSVDAPCFEDDCVPNDPAEHGLEALSTIEDRRKEGIRLLRSASARGQGDAMNEMGIIYLDGSAGMQQDYGLAKDWFERAKDAGDSYGPYNLARIYLSGLGVVASAETAEEYLRMSSARGYRVATCSLGLLVERKTIMNQIVGSFVRFIEGAKGNPGCQRYEVMEELR